MQGKPQPQEPTSCHVWNAILQLPCLGRYMYSCTTPMLSQIKCKGDNIKCCGHASHPRAHQPHHGMEASSVSTP